jgi:uncharacterized delta-60 repeat protein
MKNKFWSLPLTCFLSLFLLSSYAFPGTLDQNFGRDGKTTVDFPFTSSSTYSSSGRYVFTQQLGLIVGLGGHSQPGSKGAVGGVARVGLSPSGVLDEAYNGGKNLAWDGLNSAGVLDAQMLPDGTVLRLTQSFSLINGRMYLKLVRISVHGVDDPAFNPDFQLDTLPFPPFEAVYGFGLKLSAREDGKIYVMVRYPSTNRHYMMRFNADGNRDGTFAPGGIKYLPAFGRLLNIGVSDIIALPGGKIVIAGTLGGTNTNNRNEVFFARLNPDGDMDYSFGRGGVMRHWFGKPVFMPGLLIQGDKYVLAGSIQDPDRDLLMIRSTSRGRLDYGFGNGGIATSDFTPGGSDFATVAALDEKGRIVIAGEADQELASPSTFLVARYTADGALEAGTKTAFSATDDAGATGINIQSDGKIVVIGYARNPNTSINGNVFAFARYTDITND